MMRIRIRTSMARSMKVTVMAWQGLDGRGRGLITGGNQPDHLLAIERECAAVESEVADGGLRVGCNRERRGTWDDAHVAFDPPVLATAHR